MDTKSDFEKHVDECDQCTIYYLNPENYCPQGHELYCIEVTKSQEDFNAQVKAKEN